MIRDAYSVAETGTVFPLSPSGSDPRPTPAQRTQPMDPIIAVDRLTKRYKKATTPAVNDVSFTVAPGELFAFLGPNGAGKTTTISILTTTLAKTSGTVTIAGHDLDRDTAAVRREIGTIFQKPSIDSHLS